MNEAVHVSHAVPVHLCTNASRGCECQVRGSGDEASTAAGLLLQICIFCLYVISYVHSNATVTLSAIVRSNLETNSDPNSVSWIELGIT